jgi:hypothetical protein
LGILAGHWLYKLKPMQRLREEWGNLNRTSVLAAFMLLLLLPAGCGPFGGQR